MALCDITEDDLNELMREEAEDVFFDGRVHPGSWGSSGAGMVVGKWFKNLHNNVCNR